MEQIEDQKKMAIEALRYQDKLKKTKNDWYEFVPSGLENKEIEIENPPRALPHLLLNDLIVWSGKSFEKEDEDKLKLMERDLKERAGWMDVSALEKIYDHLAKLQGEEKKERVSLFLIQLISSLDDAESWCSVGVDSLLKGVVERFFDPALEHFSTALPHYLARFQRDAIISMVSEQGRPIIDWPNEPKWKEKNKDKENKYWEDRKKVFEDIGNMRQFFLRNRGKNVLEEIFSSDQLSILRLRIPQNGDSDEVYLRRLKRLFQIPQSLINLNMHDSNKQALVLKLLSSPLSLPEKMIGEYERDSLRNIEKDKVAFLVYLNNYYFHPRTFAEQLHRWVGDSQKDLRSAAVEFLMSKESDENDAIQVQTDKLIERGLLSTGDNEKRHPTIEGWLCIAYHFANAMDKGTWEKETGQESTISNKGENEL